MNYAVDCRYFRAIEKIQSILFTDLVLLGFPEWWAVHGSWAATLIAGLGAVAMNIVNEWILYYMSRHILPAQTPQAQAAAYQREIGALRTDLGGYRAEYKALKEELKVLEAEFQVKEAQVDNLERQRQQEQGQHQE